MPHNQWSATWLEAADGTTNEADEHLGEDRLSQARDGYLRAAEYYRLALCGTQPGTVEHRSWTDAQVSSFRAALPLLAHPAVPFAFVTDSMPIAGYLFRSAVAPSHTRPEPGGDAVTVVCPVVEHIAPESLYLLTAVPILELGLNCVIFSPVTNGGPSSAMPAEGHRGHARLIGSVVDWVQRQPGIDPDRILLPPSNRGWM